MKLKVVTLTLFLLVIAGFSFGAGAHSNELNFSSYKVGDNTSITVNFSDNKCDPTSFPRNIRHANLNYFKPDNKNVLDFSDATIEVLRNGVKLDGFLYHRDSDGIVWFPQYDQESESPEINYSDEMAIQITNVKIISSGHAGINSHIAVLPWEDCFDIDSLPPYPIGSNPIYDPNYVVEFQSPTPTFSPTQVPSPTTIPTNSPTMTPSPTITPSPQPTDKPLTNLELLKIRFAQMTSKDKLSPTPTNVITVTPTRMLTSTPTTIPLSPTITPTPVQGSENPDNSSSIFELLRSKIEALRRFLTR